MHIDIARDPAHIAALRVRVTADADDRKADHPVQCVVLGITNSPRAPLPCDMFLHVLVGEEYAVPCAFMELPSPLHFSATAFSCTCFFRDRGKVHGWEPVARERIFVIHEEPEEQDDGDDADNAPPPPPPPRPPPLRRWGPDPFLLPPQPLRRWAFPSRHCRYAWADHPRARTLATTRVTL